MTGSMRTHHLHRWVVEGPDHPITSGLSIDNIVTVDFSGAAAGMMHNGADAAGAAGGGKSSSRALPKRA